MASDREIGTFKHGLCYYVIISWRRLDNDKMCDMITKSISRTLPSRFPNETSTIQSTCDNSRGDVAHRLLALAESSLISLAMRKLPGCSLFGNELFRTVSSPSWHGLYLGQLTSRPLLCNNHLNPIVVTTICSQ